MEEVECFADFVGRLRRHETSAERQLVEVFGPVILRTVGLRLRRLGLARDVDPEDIGQQVFARFFAKVPRAFVLSNPAALAKLLVKMTREEILSTNRRFHAIRRGGENHGCEHAPREDLLAPERTADHELLEQEQLEEIRSCVSGAEWDLAIAHFSGRSWKELAAQFDQNPEALRKKLERILERVRQDLSAYTP
jgi:hypothetical protein